MLTPGPLHQKNHHVTVVTQPITNSSITRTGTVWVEFEKSLSTPTDLFFATLREDLSVVRVTFVVEAFRREWCVQLAGLFFM